MDYSREHAFGEFYEEYLNQLNYTRYWYFKLPLNIRLEVRPFLSAADLWFMDLLEAGPPSQSSR